MTQNLLHNGHNLDVLRRRGGQLGSVAKVAEAGRTGDPLPLAPGALGSVGYRGEVTEGDIT